MTEDETSGTILDFFLLIQYKVLDLKNRYKFLIIDIYDIS